jgi:acetyl-CoA carboxylase carboxyltransferase component
VIAPRETRLRIIRGLRLLQDKHGSPLPKKHGNIPL